MGLSKDIEDLAAGITGKDEDPPPLPGVLVSGEHDRIFQNSHRYALDAGIEKEWLWMSVKGILTEHEIEWLKAIKRHSQDRQFGYVYVGSRWMPPLADRMASMAGALVRNFIRARVSPVHEVIDQMNEGELAPYTCLFIPDFSAGQTMPSWRVSILFDVLMDRRLKGLQTVVAVRSMKDLGSSYGEHVKEFLEEHYIEHERS